MGVPGGRDDRWQPASEDHMSRGEGGRWGDPSAGRAPYAYNRGGPEAGGYPPRGQYRGDGPGPDRRYNDPRGGPGLPVIRGGGMGGPPDRFGGRGGGAFGAFRQMGGPPGRNAPLFVGGARGAGPFGAEGRGRRSPSPDK
jgi:hypothetical protein